MNNLGQPMNDVEIEHETRHMHRQVVKVSPYKDPDGQIYPLWPTHSYSMQELRDLIKQGFLFFRYEPYYDKSLGEFHWAKEYLKNKERE